MDDYVHVKLETLRVNQVLGTQIYEWNALDSSKIKCREIAWMRLSELFFELGESSRESPIFSPFRVGE